MNSTTQQPTYELLKDLPDGAKAGDKYYKRGDQYFNDKIKTDDCPVVEYNSYFTWQVESNVDWFRRVEVKDWEVVKMKNNYGYVHDYEQGVCDNGCTIHSVRRLSDGETFTVGEKATFGVITRFKISNGEMGVVFHELDSPKPLSTISKLPSTPPVEQETIKVVHLLHRGIGEDSVYEIKFNKMLGDGDGEKIKKAIEGVLNENKGDFKKSIYEDVFVSPKNKIMELYRAIIDEQFKELNKLKKQD